MRRKAFQNLARRLRERPLKRERVRERREIDFTLVLVLLTPLVVVLLVFIQLKSNLNSIPIPATLYVPRKIVISIPYCLLEPRFVITLVLVVTALLAPAALKEYRHYRLVCSIEEQMPTIMRIVSSILRIGETLDRAFEIIATSPIKPSNRIFAKAIALSRLSALPLIDSIRRIGLELRAQALIRFADILELASRYGAHLEETVELMARVLEAFESFRKEKQTNARPYVALIYMITFVYVFLCDTIAIISSGPLKSMLTLPTAGLKAFSEYRLYALIGMCIYTLVTQLLAASLIIGKVVYDRAKCGLVHFIFLAPTSTISAYVLVQFLKSTLITGFFIKTA